MTVKPLNSQFEDTDTISLSDVQAATATYSTTPPRPGITISGLLAIALCVAVASSAFALVYVAIEELTGRQPARPNTMLLLIASAGISWMGVIVVLSRDGIIRYLRSLHSSEETTQSRMVEVYRRQDHLATRITVLANREAELLHTIQEMARDVAATRAQIEDVLAISAADEELTLRHAVNGHRPGGLHLVE